ncbi:MAG: response regulator, partial [Leptospira sp.]|nr:response regulator [Leptospira sp.]
MESKYCKKSSRKAQYFIVFLLFIATIFSTGCAPKSIPKAQNGFFDLSLWNFEQDGEIELNGEWEFYWEKIYSYEDFHNPGLSQKLNSEKQLFQVPGPWNSFVKNLTGNKYPGRGFATLRLRTSLPPGELAVFNFWTASAYKLYCGDRLVLSAGKSEPESPIPYNGAKSGRLENCSELIWQISNYDHHFGGPRQTIRLATPTRNAILNTRKDLIETLLVGVTSIFAAYHFLLWLFRREDRLALLFSGVCFSFCMLDLSSEKYFQRILHTNVFALQYKIEFASVVSGVIFTAAFFRAFFPNELPAFFARLLTIVGTSYALYVILVPGTGFTEYVLYMQIYVMIAVVFLLAGSVLAIYRRRPYGFALGIGFIILPFLAVHDILSVRNIISTPRMVPYGILILIFTQSGILAKIFATAHNTAEHLSANLKAEVERKTIALTEANEALMQADRAKTTFFQNISHELRTPLTLILGPMESYFSRNESTPLATAEVVVRNARRLLRLVNQLLDLQKITAGRLELEPTPIDTTLFLDRIFSSFQPYASSREVELIREYDSLPLILADEDKFEKCIFNYLSNALKFTPRGGRIILRAFINETGTSVETGGKQKFVRIEVEDNGMGIPPERISGLFTRFGHSEGSLTREQEGTGLGLSLVKELIELHGGNVSVKSEVNKGSVFSLEIPVSETISFPEKDFTKGNIQAQIELGDVVTRPVSNIVFPQNDNGTGHHILVVEDNADLRDHLANIFLHAGYRITFAENGEIGLSEVMKNPPNIIVTDLMMPKMSGAEMIRRIRSTSQHNGIPIVILTGSADTDTRKQMREVGADDYLAKPFDEQELLAVIRNLLALKSRERRMVGDLKSA